LADSNANRSEKNAAYEVWQITEAIQTGMIARLQFNLLPSNDFRLLFYGVTAQEIQNITKVF
jgi:hypothetical protein